MSEISSHARERRTDACVCDSFLIRRPPGYAFYNYRILLPRRGVQLLGVRFVHV